MWTILFQTPIRVESYSVTAYYVDLKIQPCQLVSICIFWDESVNFVRSGRETNFLQTATWLSIISFNVGSHTENQPVFLQWQGRWPGTRYETNTFLAHKNAEIEKIVLMCLNAMGTGNFAGDWAFQCLVFACKPKTSKPNPDCFMRWLATRYAVFI